MNYYISDLHLSYERILEIEPARGKCWSNVSDMDEAIIRSINNKCSEDDCLWVVGDVACHGKNVVGLLKQINCEKKLVVGNHDVSQLRHSSFRRQFTEVCEHKLLTDGEYDLFLSHYPMVDWDGAYKGRWLFYGHLHGNRQVGMGRLMAYVPTACYVGWDEFPSPCTASELIEARKREFFFSLDTRDELIEKLSVQEDRSTVTNKKRPWSWDGMFIRWDSEGGE